MKNEFLFKRDGNVFLPTYRQGAPVDLPLGVYDLAYTEEGIGFESVDDLGVPSKIYDNSLQLAERCFNTYASRGKSTGVLLSGPAGSGKTLTAKLICRLSIERGNSVVLVKWPCSGTALGSLLQKVGRPVTVVFDEFEKVYRYEQESLLTLLDGTTPTNSMFVMTSNSDHAVDSHIIGRPGRVFYHIRYAGVTSELIREFCADNLANQDHMEDMVLMVTGKSFDVLCALTDECNRYGEPPATAIKFMNISDIVPPDTGTRREFDDPFTASFMATPKALKAQPATLGGSI